MRVSRILKLTSNELELQNVRSTGGMLMYGYMQNPKEYADVRLPLHYT